MKKTAKSTQHSHLTPLTTCDSAATALSVRLFARVQELGHL